MYLHKCKYYLCVCVPTLKANFNLPCVDTAQRITPVSNYAVSCGESRRI